MALKWQLKVGFFVTLQTSLCFSSNTSTVNIPVTYPNCSNDVYAAAGNNDVEALIAAGIGAKNVLQMNGLISVAVGANAVDVMRYLLDQKATPNGLFQTMQDLPASTALDCATPGTEMYNLLMQHGAKTGLEIATKVGALIANGTVPE